MSVILEVVAAVVGTAFDVLSALTAGHRRRGARRADPSGPPAETASPPDQPGL